MQPTEIIPYSPEWYEIRRAKFTSSENWKLLTEPKSAKDLISETTKGYILEKVAEAITGLTRPEIFSNATDWGHANELDALQSTANYLKVNINPGNWISYSERAGGTPDGTIEGIAVLEVKCPYNSGNHLENLLINSQEGLLKAHKEYYWQIVNNCLFTGLKQGFFISYDPRFPKAQQLKVLEIIPSEEEFERLIQKIEFGTTHFNQYLNLFQITNQTALN